MEALSQAVGNLCPVDSGVANPFFFCRAARFGDLSFDSFGFFFGSFGFFFGCLGGFFGEGFFIGSFGSVKLC